MNPSSETTRDTFFNGRLIVTQSRDGYRFSIDAVLLAATVKPKRGDTLLDLGTGCAIMPLVLAARHPDIHICAVEIQSEMAHIAQQNVSDNHMQSRITVVHADLRSLPSKEVCGPFDWVVSNPPYRAVHTGRINPNSQRAVARHEMKVDLMQLLACCRRMLRTGGACMIVYPAVRIVDLLAGMRQAGLEPKCLQAVHSCHGQVAKLILVQAVKGGRVGLCIKAPLTVYAPDGDYTEEVQEMLGL
ncbi:MAG: hypothetical protein VR64_24265 [Desulfatitalea sp. BRH_c12]|nr:MAG: hypothetical protein VR64_24265 [Desulfatitalea sp. BRH_c12]